MPDPIPVGDVLRSSSRLPGWLRFILNAVRGTKVRIGGTEILLDEQPAIRTGLDKPHRLEPPKVGGPR